MSLVAVQPTMGTRLKEDALSGQEVPDAWSATRRQLLHFHVWTKPIGFFLSLLSKARKLRVHLSEQTFQKHLQHKAGNGPDFHPKI